MTEPNKLWTYVWFSSGGTGARPNKDGIHATAFPSGISGVPAEVIESLSPVDHAPPRVPRRTQAAPGEFRGGLGQTMEVSVRGERPFTLSPLFDRTRFAAQGYAGRATGRVWTDRGQSTGEVFERKGVRDFPAGTSVTLDLPGGGGFFDPFTRNTEAVRQDVIDGLVSVAAARRDYGVVIDPATLEVDLAETAGLRAGQ